MFVVLDFKKILMYQEGFQDWDDFSVGWLTRRSVCRSSRHDSSFQHWIVKKNSLSINKEKQMAYMGISTGWILLETERLCGLRSINTMLASSPRPVMNSEQGDIPTITIFVFSGIQCWMTMVLSLQLTWMFEDSHTLAFLWIIKRIC